jgi:alkylhydroperoxidase family enzyme
MPELFVRTARRSAMAQVRHVAPVPPEDAPEPVARVYAEVERDFGMLAPPVAVHAPSPGPLTASWLMLRETLLATGTVGRGPKEVVGAAVSLANSCPYCVEVHGATLHGLLPGSDAAHVAAGRLTDLSDAAVAAVAQWAFTSGTRDGAKTPPPFPAAHAPQYLGVAVTFQYLNRVVNVLLREAPFPAALPGALRGRITRLLTRVLRATTPAERPPGASLHLLPEAPLPADMAWAASDPHVAGAFARAAAAIDEAGRRSVPPPVRDLLAGELAAWDGRPPAISRSWLDEPLSRLPEASRPAGRIALLTAFASYQCDAAAVAGLPHRDDARLIDLISWAAMAAARAIGAWDGAAMTTERTPR